MLSELSVWTVVLFQFNMFQNPYSRSFYLILTWNQMNVEKTPLEISIVYPGMLPRCISTLNWSTKIYFSLYFSLIFDLLFLSLEYVGIYYLPGHSSE